MGPDEQECTNAVSTELAHMQVNIASHAITVHAHVLSAKCCFGVGSLRMSK